MVYSTRKLDQIFNHIRQVDLNTSNLTSGFFIDHKVVFFISQIRAKN
jgi:hypothetical protein